MSRYTLPLGIFLLLLVVLGVGLTINPRIVPSPLIGKAAPNFALPTLRAPQKVFSRSDLLGKVTLLNMWATWCISCREEHEMLLQIAQSGLVPVYGINHKDNRAKAIALLNDLGDPYKANGFDENGRIGIEFGVYGLPETFVIDRKGVIAYKQIGPITPDVWKKRLKPLIERLSREG